MSKDCNKLLIVTNEKELPFGYFGRAEATISVSIVKNELGCKVILFLSWFIVHHNTLKLITAAVWPFSMSFRVIKFFNALSSNGTAF